MKSDFIIFGSLLRDIRSELNMTLKNSSMLIGITSESMKLIEDGKMLPKLETLEQLSHIYKQDIVSLFLKYRYNRYDYYLDLKNRLEAKLYFNDYLHIDGELHELEVLMKSMDNNFLSKSMNQLYLFAKAIILYKRDQEMDKALEYLVNSICITNPEFTLYNYESCTYSPMEARILMSIALVEDGLSNTSLYIDLLEFCKVIMDIKYKTYVPVCYNLSCAYRSTKAFTKSLELADEGIIACQNALDYFGIPLLYYSKGLTMYCLKDKSYADYMNKAILLCDCYGQNNIKELFVNKYQDLSKSCIS